MSIGTAIFLSSCVLAVVILYSVTKDRWRWRRIVARSALAILGIIVAVGAIVFGVTFFNEATTVTRQTEYAGLRLGMSPNEVLYIKGTPHAVSDRAEIVDFNLFDDIPSENLQLKLEKGKAIWDYPHWDYQTRHPAGSAESLLDVNFNSHGTALVTIRCISYDGVIGRCPSIAGVSDGFTEQGVIETLGPPDTSDIKMGTKVLTYRALGIGIWLKKERVYSLSITDANYRN